MPVGAEEIAIVKAASDAGLTEQGSLDFAVEELKRQAAKVGANAVVLTSRGTSTETYGYTGYGGRTFIGASPAEVVQGVAVWIK